MCKLFLQQSAKPETTMLDRYKILTVTHKRVNLKEISQYAVHASDNCSLEVRLEELKQQFHLPELMYLATCNRIMYFFVTDRELDNAFVAEFFKHINPTLEDDQLELIMDHALALSGLDALNHLLDVASSIDSLVIGERQILGQLRDAYHQCRDWGLTGDNIRLAMDHAVVSAKKVYSKTRIGEKPVSIVSLAIQRLLYTNLSKESRLLLIGAGQTNQLVAKFLAKNEFTNVTVFNRSINKAENVARTLSGNALPLSELDSYQEGFDGIIVCTGSTKPILDAELYQKLLAGESGHKVVIDLAIPHNTHPDVMRDFDVQYIEIEGLRVMAKENMAFREREVSRARELLTELLAEFPVLFKQRQVELAMRSVPTEIKAIKSHAMNEVFRKEVDSLDDGTRELVERMLSYMEKKCIGIPMKAARQLSE
jgi:glutamyl-tRNA reductase